MAVFDCRERKQSKLRFRFLQNKKQPKLLYICRKIFKMSASGTKRGIVTLSGKSPQPHSKLKLGVASKLDSKEVPSQKSAMNRNDTHLTDRLDDASVADSEFSSGINFYENTYKLLPDAKTPMPTKTVETIIADVLKERFKNEDYDSSKCKDHSQNICRLIKEKVKSLLCPRYKLVVVVHIGEKKGQGIRITSRCAWNENFDDFVTVSFTNSSLFAQATVYALYVE